MEYSSHSSVTAKQLNIYIGYVMLHLMFAAYLIVILQCKLKYK